MRYVLRVAGFWFLLTHSVWAADGFKADIFSPILGNDQAETLLGANLLTNLQQMEDKKLLDAKIDMPWSDSYWPTIKGGIAYRYADPSAPHSQDFLTNYNDFVARPPAELVRAGKADLLSPAEKYDLLVNDSNWSLTNSEWNKGRKLLASSGSIPYWMGSCDGWAAAAVSLSEPVRPAVMPTPSGVSVTFYPQDIRALASSTWSSNVARTKTIGSRCSLPIAPNRPRTVDCIQNNPATWHIAVVNQLGVKKQALIIDAYPSNEIWNYPVYSYKYSYFNVITRKLAPDLQSAMVPVESYEKDPFKQYRSDKARYIVGISMQAEHSVEIVPARFTGHVAKARTEAYLYDLELDAQGNLIGGEWYTLDNHPNMIWLPGTLYTAAVSGLGGIQTSILTQLVEQSK